MEGGQEGRVDVRCKEKKERGSAVSFSNEEALWCEDKIFKKGMARRSYTFQGEVGEREEERPLSDDYGVPG